MNQSLTHGLAVVGAIGFAGLSIFQISLAAGLPFGRAAFGGANRVLPTKLRLASGASAAVFLAALYVILARGDVLGSVGHSSWVARAGIWVLVVIFGLSTLANFFSRSRWERRIMAPVALVLTVCCLLVALS
ncbi:MAG TPA: hypothetical protein VNT80_07075 [Acidimicrobiales bacterium]|jgi:hypothetical protein|nr:hypothetical protein [Acidimicrobiales bacterium]